MFLAGEMCRRFDRLPPQPKDGKSAAQMALRGAFPLGKMKMGERKKRIGKFAAAGLLPAADGR